MKHILIVIDTQYGFINEHTIGVKNKISELLKQKIFDDVISTKYENKPGSNVEKLLGWTKLRTEASQTIVPEVEKYTDYIVEKTTYSGYNEQMKDVLKIIGNGNLPSQVFLSGIDTDGCVLATALDFFEDGIRPILLANYCGSTGGKECHLAALKTLERPIGRNNIILNQIMTRQTLDEIVNGAKTKEEKQKKEEEQEER